MRERHPNALATLIEPRPVEAFEQLDTALRIVRVRNWALLGVVFLTLAAFVLFARFVTAPLKVEGRGILLARYADGGDPVLQVTAPASGRLARVDVRIGQEVRPGEILGEIDQGELRDQIAEAEAERDRLEREDIRLTQLETEEAEARRVALDELEETLNRNLKLDSARLVDSRRISAGDSRLNARRMLNNADALKSRAEADAIESAIGATRARLQELADERVRDQAARDRDQLKRRLGIEAVETRLRLLESRLVRDTQVVSPYAGRVVDLMMTEHALLEKGAPAVLLRPLGRGDPPMEAILFVPAGPGKKVRPEDAVEIAPDTARRQEHGFIRGVVRAISEIPATERAMLAELKHPTLVSSFLDQSTGQVLLCIHADLRAAPPRAGGDRPANPFEWSSASGRDQAVSPGTLCSAAVVVERRPLITLAFPWLKELIGVE